MIKNKKLFVILKMEYGDGEENIFTEVLNASSSRSTAMAMRERYLEEYADRIHHPHDGRWVSIQMHQFGLQVDDGILEHDIFLRFIDGTSKVVHD